MAVVPLSVGQAQAKRQHSALAALVMGFTGNEAVGGLLAAVRGAVYRLGGLPRRVNLFVTPCCHQVATSAWRLVAMSPLRGRAALKTVAIIAQKGGVGKTTVAIHLATAASIAGY